MFQRTFEVTGDMDCDALFGDLIVSSTEVDENKKDDLKQTDQETVIDQNSVFAQNGESADVSFRLELYALPDPVSSTLLTVFPSNGRNPYYDGDMDKYLENQSCNSSSTPSQFDLKGKDDRGTSDHQCAEEKTKQPDMLVHTLPLTCGNSKELLNGNGFAFQPCKHIDATAKKVEKSRKQKNARNKSQKKYYCRKKQIKEKLFHKKILLENENKLLHEKFNCLTEQILNLKKFLMQIGNVRNS